MGGDGLAPRAFLLVDVLGELHDVVVVAVGHRDRRGEFAASARFLRPRHPHDAVVHDKRRDTMMARQAMATWMTSRRGPIEELDA